MKIDNAYPLQPPVASGTKASKPGAAEGSAKQKPDVFLSDTAKLAAAESEAPLDIGRIEEIKQAIADGRFKINASAIADRLVTSARDILDAQRKS